MIWIGIGKDYTWEYFEDHGEFFRKKDFGEYFNVLNEDGSFIDDESRDMVTYYLRVKNFCIEYPPNEEEFKLMNRKVHFK